MACRVVKDQNRWIHEEGSRKRNASTFACRNERASNAHRRIVPLRKFAYKPVEMGCFGGCFNFEGCSSRPAEAKIICDARVEQYRIFAHIGDFTSKAIECEISDIDSVNEHAPRARFHESAEQMGQRCFSAAVLAD